MDEHKPVIYRDAVGRRRVDLTRIKSPWIRYGIALSVVGLVVGGAWWATRDQVRSDDDFAWLVPWLGWGVVAMIALALLGRFLSGRR